jgi:type IV pilus assembly protein PilP
MTRHLLQRNSHAYTVVALLTVATLVSGCNKKEPPAPVVAPPAPVQAKQQQQVIKAVQKPVSSTSVKLASPPSSNQFDFSGKKDPFKPDSALKTSTTPLPRDLKIALQGGLPIHSFDVTQFRLIGVVTGAKENQAMVVDPNGKGYVLKTGMTIGKNNGRVTAVGINGVDIVEQFKDDSGRVRKENIRITLPRKQ